MEKIGSTVDWSQAQSQTEIIFLMSMMLYECHPTHASVTNCWLLSLVAMKEIRTDLQTSEPNTLSRCDRLRQSRFRFQKCLR